MKYTMPIDWDIKMNIPVLFQVNAIQRITTSMIKDFIQKHHFSLRIEQLSVFMCIHNFGILSQQEIADYLMRDKSSIQRTITCLLANELIVCGADATDKRKNLITLSYCGKKIAAAITSFLIRIEKEYFGERTLTNHAYFENALQKMTTEEKTIF